MPNELRILTDEPDIRRAAWIFRTAMVGLPPPRDLDVAEQYEQGRTLGAFADGELVGATDSYSGWLVVPGGARLPHAGVTHVGVLPSHTRRGLASALLRRQLDDIAERGAVLASLRASEAVIYERFGYAVASWTASLELDRRRAALRPGVAGGGPVRLLDPEQAGPLIEDIYAAATWTGAVARSKYWWRQQRDWAGPGPRYVAVHGAPGAEDGYVDYHPLDTPNWFGGGSRTIAVDDLVAHTPEAYAGLIRYLGALDLVDVVRFDARPVDDPLPAMLVDTRAVRTTRVRDETWLRIVDVPAALSGRSYRDAGAVVLAVTDELRPSNTGRYRVSAAGAERTDDAEDLALDVAALASVYLGGTSWRQLEQSGRLVVRSPGAARSAADLFAADPAPFAGTIF